MAQPNPIDPYGLGKSGNGPSFQYLASNTGGYGGLRRRSPPLVNTTRSADLRRRNSLQSLPPIRTHSLSRPPPYVRYERRAPSTSRFPPIINRFSTMGPAPPVNSRTGGVRPSVGRPLIRRHSTSSLHPSPPSYESLHLSGPPPYPGASRNPSRKKVRKRSLKSQTSERKRKSPQRKRK